MRGILPQGEKILSARVAAGITQRELAVLTKLDIKTIRKAEQGIRLDIASLARIAEVLQMETEQLQQRTTDADERYDLVVQWINLFNAHDRQGIENLFHPEGTLVIAGGAGIPFGGEFNGREAIGRTHETNWNTVKQEPPKQEECTFLISEEGITLRGEIGVYLPNGELAHFLCIQIFSFRDQLIHRLESQFDTLEFAKRMGLV